MFRLPRSTYLLSPFVFLAGFLVPRLAALVFLAWVGTTIYGHLRRPERRPAAAVATPEQVRS